MMRRLFIGIRNWWNYLVSVQEWPFSAIPRLLRDRSASNYRFPCAVPLKAGYVSASRPGGIFLDLANPAAGGTELGTV